MGKILQGREQLTLSYGNQKLKGRPYKHTGIDVVKYKNRLDKIIAIQDGTVVGVRSNVKGFVNNSYGNYVLIKHEQGYSSFYGHLSNVYVRVGQKVKKGQEIGYMGATGMSFGAHLHFEIRKNNKQIDPYHYVFGNLVIPNRKSGNYKLIPEKWRFTVGVNKLNVREKPSTNSKVVAQYSKGQRINYDSYVKANGYVWISYIAKSGKRRYVATGHLVNGKNNYAFGHFR